MAVLTVAVIGLVLLALNEVLWRHHKKTDEFSRKFVHITVGSFVATWPFFLSWNEIRILSVTALIVVVVSKYFNILNTIHSVTRPSWGEAWFAIGVGLTTFVTHRPAIYAASLVQVGLADGLAAVVGTKYGKGNTYKVRGQTKSLAGSGTFLFISYLAVLSFAVFSAPLAIGWCLAIAIIATGLENIAPHGLDNLVLPLFVALTLQVLA
jgi:phytol kinase